MHRQICRANIKPIRNYSRNAPVLSTFLYLVYVDELLSSLSASPYGAKVMSVICSNPAFADDISLISTSPYSLQRLIDIVYQYCRAWNIEINVDKLNIIVFSQSKKSLKAEIVYGEKFPAQTNSLVHLGIVWNYMKELLMVYKEPETHLCYVISRSTPVWSKPTWSKSLYSKLVLPTLYMSCGIIQRNPIIRPLASSNIW